MRDDDAYVIDRLAELRAPLLLSVVSVVELEGGVHREASRSAIRRLRVDTLLASVTILDFTAREAEAYGRIMRACGYSRRKLLDRMIAAQALVHGATLVTRNPDDFGDVPGLDLLAW